MKAATSVLKVIESIRDRGPVARFGTQIAVDALAWAVGLVLAALLRYEFEVGEIGWVSLSVVIVAAIALQFLFGWLVHLYRGRHPYGGFAEVRALVVAVFWTALVVGLAVIGFGTLIHVPRSIVLIAAPIALVIMGGMRYVKRLLVERASRPETSERVLIYGAGYLGSSIARRMLTDHASRYEPVGFIDDAKSRRNTWHHGVRVLGSGADLPRIAEETGATVLIVAIAAADRELLASISDAASSTGLKIKVFPPLDEILEGKSRLRDLRVLSIEDLLGRQPVDTDVEAVAGYLSGKTVLVTGAGGSIGSELSRQISKFHPAALIFVDHDETALQNVQMSITGDPLLQTDDTVLLNIRDADSVRAAFEKHRPDVVFHAAALKHLPMLERYPEEAWRTNVLGTWNVLSAALAVGVKTFVNVSTDKAADATSVLGRSKRLAERLTAWAAERSGETYVSVRFGNVLGSRGSMLPAVATLIDQGGPVRVTDADATRYFMSIPEACQLVIQAGAIGSGSEVLILDMGQPVRILDIVQRMIDMSGEDIGIVFTGLRPGEKLHEDLFDPEEDVLPSTHPKISRAFVEALDPGSLEREGLMAEMSGRP